MPRQNSFFRNFGVALSLMLSAGLCSATQASAGLNPKEMTDADAAINAVRPALVRIHVAEADYDEGREIKYESYGSGAIITKDGYIVTNHHVAGKAKRIVCTLTNKKEIEADLIGTDPLMDIAVIKLRLDGKQDLQPAKWGDSSTLVVGDRVLAMGSPMALSQSVTMGIIANTEMIMPDYAKGEMTMDGEDVGSMVRWIGHDAQIWPGNSGGPLVNLKGEIVGVNEISMGLSGAIPSNIAKMAAEEIIKSGRVHRSWLGISIQPLLKSGNMDHGVLIGGIVPGSPASKANLKSGDIILKLDGKDVSVVFEEQSPLFNQLVASLPIGQPVNAVVLRDGKQMDITMTTSERPEAIPTPKEFKLWGMCASNLSFIEACELKRPSQNGVLVSSIRPGGPCGEAKPDLQEGDLIVQVDGKAVATIDDLAKVTSEITNGKSEPVPVLVNFDRNNEHFITVVKVGIQTIEDPGNELRKAYLPVGTQVLTEDIADALGVTGNTGVRITQVYPGSSAEKAGLKVGDLIIKLDDESIEASQPEDTQVLPTMIRQYKIGTTAKLTIIRDKKEMVVPVVLEETPRIPREMLKYRDENFEFVCRDITFQDELHKNLEKQTQGVYVEEVTSGGWAALGRLASGDIVCAVDNQPINNVKQLREVMQQISELKPKHVVLKVQRGIQESYVELETDWPVTTSKGESK